MWYVENAKLKGGTPDIWDGQITSLLTCSYCCAVIITGPPFTTLLLYLANLNHIHYSRGNHSTMRLPYCSQMSEDCTRFKVEKG